MNRTQHYMLRKHKLNGAWNFDIEQENLVYADCAPTHHGLQCNHIGGTPEHVEIMSLCDQIVELMKKVDALNNP